MVDLILRPSALSADPRRRWALQLRWHESFGETEYHTVARITDGVADEIMRAGKPCYLFGRDRPGDWKAELAQLEPEAMRPDDLMLEVRRLRALVGPRAGDGVAGDS